MNKIISIKELLLYLFIIAIVMFFPLKILSTYIHETGHIKEAEKQNIILALKWNFSIDKNNLNNLKNFGKGMAEPKSKEDCEKFNIISLENKKKITHAGVKAQLVIFVPLFLILIFLFIKYSKHLYSNKFILYFLIAILILIFALILVTIKYNILSSNPTADWNKVFLNCSGF